MEFFYKDLLLKRPKKSKTISVSTDLQYFSEPHAEFDDVIILRFNVPQSGSHRVVVRCGDNKIYDCFLSSDEINSPIVEGVIPSPFNAMKTESMPFIVSLKGEMDIAHRFGNNGNQALLPLPDDMLKNCLDMISSSMVDQSLHFYCLTVKLMFSLEFLRSNKEQLINLITGMKARNNFDVKYTLVNDLLCLAEYESQSLILKKQISMIAKYNISVNLICAYLINKNVHTLKNDMIAALKRRNIPGNEIIEREMNKTFMKNKDINAISLRNLTLDDLEKIHFPAFFLKYPMVSRHERDNALMYFTKIKSEGRDKLIARAFSFLKIRYLLSKKEGSSVIFEPHDDAINRSKLMFS